MSAVLTAAS